jgi:hypothetical protein
VRVPHRPTRQLTVLHGKKRAHSPSPILASPHFLLKYVFLMLNLERQSYEIYINSSVLKLRLNASIPTAQGLPLFCLPLCGTCVTVYPKTAVVTTVYGKFFHNFSVPGLYFVNPCGREAQVVSLKTTSVELQAVKVADANGNPLVISGVVNYRVVDATRAALDVLHLGK